MIGVRATMMVQGKATINSMELGIVDGAAYIENGLTRSQVKERGRKEEGLRCR